MKLRDLVKIDPRFEKSVNLLLDLNNRNKLKLYIPTRSSINLLMKYISEVDAFSGKRSTILIGSYGKGKSHLMLVLMALLSGLVCTELDDLLSRIGEIDKNAEKSIRKIYKKKKLLPVIISTSNGNLAQAFVRSLSQALKREGLLDVVPANYFDEAIKTIDKWRVQYKETYNKFKKILDGREKEFLKDLKNHNYATLNEWRELYPSLTAGSEFNPTIDEDVITVFQSINRTLCERYGYSGIYIIFDEFSKYIEGHTDVGFASDMKVLQDICELCNSSVDEQLHIICIAHKPIKSYTNAFSRDKLNAFRGVEGRLDEIQFVVSSQNNYELIADAIKKKKAYSKWKKESDLYNRISEEAFRIKELTSLFEKNDFKDIVVDGVFPLTPLSSLLLIRICEMIAQNERTIFTFLTSKDVYSLASCVEKKDDVAYIGTSLIYDYFSQTISEVAESYIHDEWLKAEYALGCTTNVEEIEVIKALAIIRINNCFDSIPANSEFVSLATGLCTNICDEAISRLKEQKLIYEDETNRLIDFKNRKDVDVSEVVKDCIKKYYTKINTSDAINEISSIKYILPKKYNQDHYMTRYFKVHAIAYDSYMSLKSLSYIQDKNIPDGYLIVIIDGKRKNKDEIKKNIIKINDARAIVAIGELDSKCKSLVQRIYAINRLLGDKEYISNNRVIKIELTRMRDATIATINEKYNDLIYSISELYTIEGKIDIGSKGINRSLSDIAEKTYYRTPHINHELINRHFVTAQTSKARNNIVDDIIHRRTFEKYGGGTSAESTIYRTCTLHTNGDPNIAIVREEIVRFIFDSKGKKNSFSKLVCKLTSAPIGMRMGVIPIYLAEILAMLEDMPTIYHDRVEISLDAKLITDVVMNAEKHYLYVEEETAEKLEYIESLEDLFSEYGEYCKEIERLNRLARLKCYIQAWYRALPQAATVFTSTNCSDDDMTSIVALRKLLVGEVNARELIFDQIPKAMKEDKLCDVMSKLMRVKSLIDNYVIVLKVNALDITRQTLHLPPGDDLTLSLKSWHENISEMSKKSILPMDTQLILNCIRDIDTRGTDEVIEKLSKVATNFYVEDWTDNTINDYRSALEKLCTDIEERDMSNSLSNQKIIIQSDDTVKECFYDFDSSEISASGHFFKSALDDVLEEYEGVLDNSEKIGILMTVVQKLVG